jgi:hypothetical protein
MLYDTPSSSFLHITMGTSHSKHMPIENVLDYEKRAKKSIVADILYQTPDDISSA